MTTAIATTPMMMNRRRGFCLCSSSGWSIRFCSSVCTVVCSATLLSSDVTLVVLFSHAQCARKRELGNIVLVQAAHILVVCLRDCLLRLGDGEVVRNSGDVALLCFAQGLICELHVAARHFHLLLCCLDVENAVADIGADLALQVA